MRMRPIRVRRKASEKAGAAQNAHEATEDAGRASEGAQKVPGWVGGDNLLSGSYTIV